VIEINLLPGSTKRTARRSMPRVGAGLPKMALPGIDRTLAILVGVTILVVAAIAYLHFSNTSRLNELRAEEEAAVRDSARYATLRTQGDSIRQQIGVIAQKLQVVQELDGARYIWPHIFDEVSRALPPYVWLVNITESGSSESLPRIRMEGRAGNYFALGRYIQQLESSPFLGGARLVSSSQTVANERTVYTFVLEVSYREPPPDAIQTVPLFTAATAEPEE
jgi:Tfp pilus assembly protein PilN